MPIKKDETGKRWVEMELLVPGTPEQVWQALATGPGNSAWFTSTTIEEKVGGRLEFGFGPGVISSGEVTQWEPPHWFGYVEREWNEGAPPVATEIVITPRAGGQCVVRMVHSLFSSTDDWDDQLEGFQNGWPGFFEVLRIYLGHFAGRSGASFMAMAGAKEDPLALWTRLTDALGLAGANVGERRTTPAEPERLSGVVEHVHQDGRTRMVVLRLDAPAPGVAIVGAYQSNASLTVYLYDAPEIATASEAKWRGWFARTFPGDD